MIGIYRKAYRWDTYNFMGMNLSVSRPTPDPVMFLTDDWKIHGNPVDWGIEPVIDRIRMFDAWNKPNLYEEIVKERETVASNKKRELSNNVRAMAADLRKEFAATVNDINTSSLEMTDKRRIKDGSCK